ncbi:MAG: hypothetical protein JWP57_132, partial [Spirosoma sp.]|nr:hypothetical protein [Spirosoma sp.]
MTRWQDLLATTSADAKVHFERLKEHLFGRLDRHKPYKIVYYRGFGSPTAVWLKGRILRERELSTPSDNDAFWQNILATYQRFESDEVPGITVRVEAFGQSYTVVTDEDGFFEVTVNPPDNLPTGRVWFPVRYSLDGIVQPSMTPGQET